MALSFLRLKTVSSPPWTNPCRKTHSLSEVRPQSRGIHPPQTRNCFMADLVSRNGRRGGTGDGSPPKRHRREETLAASLNCAEEGGILRSSIMLTMLMPPLEPLSGNRVPERSSEA